jgi:hypothetical protein
LIDDHAFGDRADVVAIVEGEIGLGITDPVAKKRVRPIDRAGDRLCVGIDKDLGGVESEAGFRLVQAMDTIAIELARPDLRKVDVPLEVVAFLVPVAVVLACVLRALEE